MLFFIFLFYVQTMVAAIGRPLDSAALIVSFSTSDYEKGGIRAMQIE